MNDTNRKPATTKKDETTAVQKNLEDIGKRINAIRKELRLKQAEMVTASRLSPFRQICDKLMKPMRLFFPWFVLYYGLEEKRKLPPRHQESLVSLGVLMSWWRRKKKEVL